MKNTVVFLLLAAAGLYALLLAKPELYFNKRADYREFTVRARGALPASLEGTLESARERLAASELYKEGDRFELFLPSSRREYEFFTPLQGGAYFRVSPLGGAIFLAAADFQAGEARKTAGDAKFRSLSSVIAGAAAWELTRRRLKPLTYVFMHEWKVRGYGELISGGTGEFNPADACAPEGPPEQQDYSYGLMLDTVLKEEQVRYGDLLDRNFSYQSAAQRLQKAHCGG